MDKVTELQDRVDELALGMFNALRLLPVDAKEKKTTDDASPEQPTIQSLATSVIATMRVIDNLIDELPGLNTSESEQLQELGQLQKLCIEEGENLQLAAKNAEKWISESRTCLKEIAEDKLKYR